MCKTLIATGIVLLAALAQARAAELPNKPTPGVWYVAPDGNDSWSGKLPAPKPDRTDGPFATPRRARDEVRAIRKGQTALVRQRLVVRFRGGTYPLAEPLTLTPEDAGTASSPTVFEAAPGEKPVFSGGRAITGWKEGERDGRKVWTAGLPEVKAGKVYYHQLWVNGRRAVRARSPNEGFHRIARLPDLDPKLPYNKNGSGRFEYAPGDLKAFGNLRDVEVVALHYWVAARLAVESIDADKRVVTFAAPTRRRLTEGFDPKKLAPYYVENAIELLDAPGEWYLDRATGVLTYLPRPGERIDTAKAVVARQPELLRLAGKPEEGHFVEHVIFRGLAFEHQEWWPDRKEPLDLQAATPVAAAITADGARHCAFERCAVRHVAGYGLHLRRGCQDNAVVGCTFSDLGAGGVRVGEPTIRKDEREATQNNRVTDCTIHAGGRIFHQAIGVWVGQSPKNTIAHNHIHDFYYTAISVGWTWGYSPSNAAGNVIEANHIHDLGQGWLSDLAGVYTLGRQPGTVVRGNVIHDVTGRSYGGWGVYFDEGSTGVVAEKNLVYRTTHGGFHQHFGRENVVRNNVFAFGRDDQLRGTRPEDHLSFTFERNIVYGTRGKLADGRWGEMKIVADRNDYWLPGGELKFGKLTWEEWRKAGHDEDSVIADPLFVAPEKGDFRLKPESPALKLGFDPLGVSKVGPRPSSQNK